MGKNCEISQLLNVSAGLEMIDVMACFGEARAGESLDVRQRLSKSESVIE